MSQLFWWDEKSEVWGHRLLGLWECQHVGEAREFMWG